MRRHKGDVMSREITDHKVNGCNEVIQISAEDGPGPGGANHLYVLSLPDSETWLRFQNGPIKESGTNGITHEALLAVVVDRLRGFQSGPYACRENALALTKLEEAMHWLHSRTRARVARGVEGTHAK
jgi:hypothetical protein